MSLLTPIISAALATAFSAAGSAKEPTVIPEIEMDEVKGALSQWGLMKAKLNTWLRPLSMR
ncbi:MAG: hypothetical protein HDS62_04355 [Bacteroidales bacterium]|nr:hypothetical protein [Bacteroidales bacterium]